MRILWNTIFVAAALAAFGTPATAAPPGGHATPAPARQPVALTAPVQPRLSSLMNDYGNRFVDTYFAAEGQNWALAQYQLGEMMALGKSAALLRPDSAPRLDAFAKDYLAPLEESVMAKDWSKFGDSYRRATGACNDCHVTMKRGFIRFERPPRPAEDYIDFMTRSDPIPADPAR
jgi:hypothetical protein